MGRRQQLAIYCHTGLHEHHRWVPWHWGKPYDKACDICGHPAAWVSGKAHQIPLCDCCAEDWSEWCTLFNPLLGTGRATWMVAYTAFRKAAKRNMELNRGQ